MAKRRSTQSRSFSQIVMWIVSILVVISMAIGFLLTVLPGPEPPTPLPTPTVLIPGS